MVVVVGAWGWWSPQAEEPPLAVGGVDLEEVAVAFEQFGHGHLREVKHLGHIGLAGVGHLHHGCCHEAACVDEPATAASAAQLFGA